MFDKLSSYTKDDDNNRYLSSISGMREKIRENYAIVGRVRQEEEYLDDLED